MKRVLTVAGCLALLVRLPIVVSEQGLVSRFSTISDMRGYDALAQSLKTNGTFAYGRHLTAFRPPLYPLFLAAVYAFVPHSFRLARAAQACVFLILLPILYKLGARLVNPLSGFVASLLAAIYPLFVHYSTELLSESVAIVMVPLTLLLFLELEAAPSVLAGVLLGAAMAVVLLLRSQLLPVFLSMIAMLLMRWLRGPGGASVRNALLALLISAILLLSPWVLRNAMVFGAFIPFSTNSGYALYDGVIAYKSADWNSHKELMRANLGFHRSDIEREDLQVEFDEVAFDKRARDLAFEEILRHPGRFLVTLAENARGVFLGIHDEDLQAVGSGQIPLKLVISSMPYWVVLGLGSMFVARHRRILSGQAKTILLLAVVGALAGVPFAASLRHRVPILDPVVILFAGACLAHPLRGLPVLERIAAAQGENPDG